MYKGSLHLDIDPADMAGSCCVDPLAVHMRRVPCLARVWRQQNAMVPACRERAESGVLLYMHMGLPHPESVWNSSAAVHTHRAALSRESVELGECCKAHMQSTCAQTWLKQWTKQQSTLCAHWVALPRSEGQGSTHKLGCPTRNPLLPARQHTMYHTCLPRLQPACQNHLTHSLHRGNSFKIGRDSYFI